MATNDIKILKLDGSGIWTEFNLTAEASKVVGFDGDINPVMVSPSGLTKATGAEIDTGTDDAKYVTAKALADQTVLFKKTGGALSGALNEAKGTDIASGSTTDIGAATGNYVVVTGTTTITGLGTIQAGTRRIVNFSGALILTHHATALILPTGANITTVAGDTAIFISLGSGNWVCTSYQRKDGTALAAAGGGSTPTHVKLTSPFATTSPTFVDVTGITLNVTTGKTYKLDLTVNADGDESTDKIQFYLVGVTATLAIRGVVIGSYDGGTGRLFAIDGIDGANYTSNISLNPFVANITAIIVVSDSSGSIKLQAKRQTGAGSGVVVYTGTTMTLTEVQ